MKIPFIASRHQALLAQHKLDTFDGMWDFKVDWFETPNERRGGWSGVGRVKLESADGTASVFFVKKQQNHGRRTLRHPIKGEPTFRREFERLRFLSQHGFAAPVAVFYAESDAGGDQRAILVTEALSDFVPLDALEAGWRVTANQPQQHDLIMAVADALRRFHDFGLVHRALYPKHIFVKNAGTLPEIALIDLEKTRFSPWFRSRAAFDLAALCRHAEGWRAAQKMAFFLRYMRLKKLDAPAKQLCRAILRRAAR